MNPQPFDRPPAAAGIVFALGVEADGFAAIASDVIDFHAGGLVLHEGFVADRRIAWCTSGAGIESASKATSLLIDGHRPRLIISAGFAGGLDASVRQGTVAYPTCVLRRGTSATDLESIPLRDFHPDPAFPTSTAHTTQPRLLMIISVDSIICTAMEKKSLNQTTGAHLVDMETFGVAFVARAAGLPCASIRVISDDAQQNLPTEIARLVQPQSLMRRFGVTLAAITRRPRSAIDMWRLWEHAVVDGKTLAQALKRTCQSLPNN